MPEILERVTTDCLVKSKAEVEDGWKVELDIPHFQSKFPTFCTRVDKELAVLLKVGSTQRLTLNRQAIKKDQSGKPKTGQYWSDYYWGLAAITPDGAPTPSASRQEPEKAAPTPPARWGEAGIDPTRVSIERQKAAAIAFDAAKEGEDIGGTLARAEAIYQWIANGPMPFSPQARQSPDPPQTTARPSKPPPVASGGTLGQGPGDGPVNPALAGLVAGGQKAQEGRMASPEQRNAIAKLQARLGDPENIPGNLTDAAAQEVIRHLNQRLRDKADGVR